jgi:putative hemolysin
MAIKETDSTDGKLLNITASLCGSGVLLAKDVLLRDESRPFVLNDAVRPVLFLPATRSAQRVLDDFRKKREQMAVVLDEYGGMAGILTIEDLIEEVVGDINDEYDQVEREAVEVDGIQELAGGISLVDARSNYDLSIPEGMWTTLGGYVFGQLGRLPTVGDRVKFPGGELEVVAIDGKRVAAVRVLRVKGASKGRGRI